LLRELEEEEEVAGAAEGKAKKKKSRGADGAVGGELGAEVGGGTRGAGAAEGARGGGGAAGKSVGDTGRGQKEDLDAGLGGGGTCCISSFGISFMAECRILPLCLST